MKSELETLNPTRVKLTVAVPFEELKPSLDAAYKKIAAQVNIPGFRKGKVPPRVIDQRFGRSVVLEEAVNEALPRFYGQAVEENSVKALGQPDVDVTEFADGESLTFTAEVDVRPEFEVPDYQGLEVTVEDAEVTDAEVDEQLDGLRDRFATLTGVERPAADGDFVSIDLSATVDGEAVDDLTAKGLSYQVGQGSLLDGLDEAITGLSAGESQDFPTALVGGDHAGQDATVTVTVQSVKDRELPPLDDDFAQTGSEFDTLDELRDDVRNRLDRMKKLQQGVQARDRVLEALLAKVDIPLPESVVQAEVEGRSHSLSHQLEAAGMSKEDFLAAEGQSEEEFDADIDKRTREALTAQFVLDRVVEQEQLSVNEQELSEHIIRTASRYGMGPDQFAQQIVQAGQVPALVGEVVRGKALALVLEQAKVVDESGREVDLEALREEPAEETVGQPVEAATDASAEQSEQSEEQSEQS
ncbi:MAG: trigger factor [Actinomycetota bacterium]|nr:trigger factor [Actinomycetota bacterium]MDQ1667815.1 trigger factor [Actinomycetota bacterium]